MSCMACKTTVPDHVRVQILWAFARLGYHPGRPWMRAVLARVQELLGGLAPEGLTCVLHAVVWLKHIPSSEFMQVSAWE